MCQPKEDGFPLLSLVPLKVSSFATTLIMFQPLVHDVPHCCLREFFLATVAFWLAHWGIKARHVQNKVFNKMIEIYFVSVAISFIFMSLIFYLY